MLQIQETFFTARVRTTREGNIYTWKCLSVHFWGGGGTQSSLGHGGSQSSLGWWEGGVYPIQPWMRGGSQSSLGQGVPNPAWMGEGIPIQPWMGGPDPALDRGYPNLEWGVSQPWMGGYPSLGQGGTPSLGGTQSLGIPPIASTYYGFAVGGVSLAFMQEDFLVIHIFTEIFVHNSTNEQHGNFFFKIWINLISFDFWTSILQPLPLPIPPSLIG